MPFIPGQIERFEVEGDVAGLVANLPAEVDQLHAAVGVGEAHEAQTGRTRSVSGPQLRDEGLGIVAGRVLNRPRRADLRTPPHSSSVTRPVEG